MKCAFRLDYNHEHISIIGRWAKMDLKNIQLYQISQNMILITKGTKYRILTNCNIYLFNKLQY